MAVSWSGQVTPPRSSSTTSTDLVHTKLIQHRRGVSKGDVTDAGHTAITVDRQRRNARKRSTVSLDNFEENEKRKLSLEKNRAAAARCRVNKKERTEQLWQDSSDKVVHNAYLKDQVLRMKEQVHQMNVLLLAHVNGDGCKSPEDIQRHLSHLGHDFYPQQIASTTQFTYPAYPQYESGHAMQLNYLCPGGQPDWLNLPFHGCNRESSFDTTIPMHTNETTRPP